MKKLSLVVSVLESYEVVRRQLLHLGRVLTPECELILVDDGSVPPLRVLARSVLAAAVAPKKDGGETAQPVAGEPAGRTVQPRHEGKSPAIVNREESHENAALGEARAALLTLIPRAARKLLDIGCGDGWLGAAVKARQAAEVTGIDSDPRMATAAQSRLDRVVVGDPGEPPSDFSPASFDAIVCAGVLQHVGDPVGLLRRARGWLRSGGRLLASIANVRHHSIAGALLDGTWAYEPTGVRARDYLRSFTRRDIEKLFYRAGLSINELQGVCGSGYEEWKKGGRLGEVRAGRLHVGGMPPDDAEEFYIREYLLSAIASDVPQFGRTSIIVLTHNQLDYTRMCLESIRLRTDEPYELIVVDNGSTDDTVDYLRTLADVKLIANEDNRGFPAAVNQGIRAASGDHVLLLNNDCVVTTGWLLRLLRALHSERKIGLVGPCSNCVSGEQQVEVTYEDDLMGLDGFAWDWGKSHNRNLIETDRLVGFCLLIRRDLVDKVGLLDERFGMGCFEDDDYCRRALRAGYRAVIAQDAFVHHFGGRTFVGSGVDFAALLRKNKQLFQAKWDQSGRGEELPGAREHARAPSHAGSYAVRLAPGGGLALVRQEIELSLCMIVRDNARTIEAALQSIKPWVDEMVVVDTGSKDDTPQIVKRLGARLFRFSWCDDFSAARNESVRHARGRWVFWMDSDDTIDADNGRKLRQLARRPADPSLLGYVMQVHCPGSGEDGEADITVVDHLKLFRNLPHLRFDGRIHEQILPAIRRAGGEVAFTDLFVRHTGYDHTPQGQERKKVRDFRLLHLELKERPDHPFTLFNLGMTCADVGQYGEAVDYLKRSIEHSGAGESHLRKAYALLVHALGHLEQREAAWEACQKGLALFPEDAELRFREGYLLHERGCLKEAVEAYQTVLRQNGKRHFSSVDRGIRGFKARQNLAVVYTEMGDLAAAEEQWRHVVEQMPRYRAGWRGLGEVLLQQEKEKEALALAQQCLSDPHLRGQGLVLKGLVAAKRGTGEQARKQLERAVRENSDDLDIRHTLCRFLFEHGEPADAEQALKQLVRFDSKNAAAHHNLGTVSMRLGRYSEAVNAYRESLRHRPNSPGTYLQLGYALKESGRLKEAVGAWKQLLRLSPGDPAATETLRQAQATAKKRRRRDHALPEKR